MRTLMMRSLLISAASAFALLAAGCSPENDASDAAAAETEAPPAKAAAADPAEDEAADGADAGEEDLASEGREDASEDPETIDLDAQERQLADRLMESMGIDVMVETLPDIFSESAARSVTSCTPATPEQDVREIERLMREELVKAAPKYFERLRDSYVRRLSLAELQAMVDFYETPEGRGVAEAAGDLVYDQYVAQHEIDRASLRAYERMGWCDNEL